MIGIYLACALASPLIVAALASPLSRYFLHTLNHAIMSYFKIGQLNFSST